MLKFLNDLVFRKKLRKLLNIFVKIAIFDQLLGQLVKKQISRGVKICKNFFYTFLHFSNINQNQMSKNKIEPTEPIEPIELKLDFS